MIYCEWSRAQQAIENATHLCRVQGRKRSADVFGKVTDCLHYHPCLPTYAPARLISSRMRSLGLAAICLDGTGTPKGWLCAIGWASDCLVRLHRQVWSTKALCHTHRRARNFAARYVCIPLPPLSSTTRCIHRPMQSVICMQMGPSSCQVACSCAEWCSPDRIFSHTC